MKGKLDTTREVTVGYSWGGGAAIDTADRPNVKATVSIHGMPPRRQDAFATLHAPLLLLTSVGDSFVTSSGYVHPNYESSSKVPTIYAQLQDSAVGQTVDHLFIVDEGASSCVANLFLGDCGSAKYQRAPTIAFLRYFACNDQGAKKFFYGSDATLCKTPWMCEKKPASAW
jgi:dienelactone hydrolase